MPEPLVLCYHAVSERWDAPLSVTPGTLRHQLSSLLSRGWTGAGFTDAVLRPGARTLAVTFDDAFESVSRLAAPVLAELGLVGTVFVATDWVGRALGWPEVGRWGETEYADELAAMSWESLRALDAAGWEIGAHTASHPHLSRLDSPMILSEVQRSRAVCEQEIGRPCRSMAYPFGDADGRSRAAAANAGYEAAAGLSPAAFRNRDRFEYPRVGMWNGEPDWRVTLKSLPITSVIRRARWAPGLDGMRRRRKTGRVEARADAASRVR